ncbi:plasmid mobilization protein [Pontibacter litorisediminis]|uniref:plasmid mobilization protein n=1 Tax=Pontibacter litorisediminis TaxID=1846260 RepID=UPI0023EBEE9E|nr:hypothetical protein [Pontibacter litorisediminis]
MEQQGYDENWKPKGGRPRSENPRDNTYKIRFTDDERKDLDTLAADAGYTDLSAYIRARLFSGDTDYNPKELFVVANRTGAALKKIGTDINQVARYVRLLEKHNILSEQVLQDFNRSFAELIQIEEEYVKAIRAFLRAAK